MIASSKATLSLVEFPKNCPSFPTCPVSSPLFDRVTPAQISQQNIMDQQWRPYTDVASNRPLRYSHSTSQQQPREPNNSATAQQHSSPSGFSYEAYSAPSVSSHSQSMATSPIGTPRARASSGDGDIAMDDADPYNRMKYPSRPNHQHRTSGQQLLQEDSTAARRYSPMKALSPSSHYTSSAHHPGQPPYTPQTPSARQSPTRTNPYSSPPQSYYATPSTYFLFNQSCCFFFLN